jgi:NAD(P)-dependent dehydrogenase (short-subunit alcohol dehydrogenase family)
MSAEIDLTGRVALVTGGGRGIGRAVALALGRAGAAVAVNYRRDEDAAAQVVKDITSAGGTAGAYPASIGDLDALDGLVSAVAADLGPIDLLVNNAGMASRGQSVVDTDAAELPRLMAVNAFGPHRLAQLVVPEMRSRPRGDIVFVSSAEVQRLSANGAPYSMAKAAMEALAFTLAKEERPHGTHVNVVAPGLVATDMGERLVAATVGASIGDLDSRYPFGRVCTPDDVAGAILFLVSGLAGYVTGQRIGVDGGLDLDPVLSGTATAS